VHDVRVIDLPCNVDAAALLAFIVAVRMLFSKKARKWLTTIVLYNIPARVGAGVEPDF
jgi:hypothetical protein